MTEKKIIKRETLAEFVEHSELVNDRFPFSTSILTNCFSRSYVQPKPIVRGLHAFIFCAAFLTPPDQASRGFRRSQLE